MFQQGEQKKTYSNMQTDRNYLLAMPNGQSIDLKVY